MPPYCAVLAGDWLGRTILVRRATTETWEIADGRDIESPSCETPVQVVSQPLCRRVMCRTGTETYPALLLSALLQKFAAFGEKGPTVDALD